MLVTIVRPTPVALSDRENHLTLLWVYPLKVYYARPQSGKKAFQKIKNTVHLLPAAMFLKQVKTDFFKTH